MNDFEKKKYWKYVQEFIVELKTAKYWCKPDGGPLPEWRLFEADTLGEARDAAWAASRDASRVAAGDAAGDAARVAGWAASRDASRVAARVAAWDAAGVAGWIAAWDAAWDAAGVAGWIAAWDAAGVAAGDAARDASRDAGIFVELLVCIGLNIEMKHVLHVNARMQVWRKGYCLLCDVNGVLYVYAKKVKK